MIAPHRLIDVPREHRKPRTSVDTVQDLTNSTIYRSDFDTNSSNPHLLGLHLMPHQLPQQRNIIIAHFFDASVHNKAVQIASNEIKGTAAQILRSVPVAHNNQVGRILCVDRVKRKSLAHRFQILNKKGPKLNSVSRTVAVTPTNFLNQRRLSWTENPTEIFNIRAVTARKPD